MATGLCARALAGHRDKVTAAVWSPETAEKPLLATASVDRSVRVWDVANLAAGVPCVAVLEGHEGRVTSLSWGADGRHLITASTDGTARLWVAAGTRPLGAPWRCVRVFRPGRGGILPCAAYESGKGVLAAVSAEAVDLWHVRVPEETESASEFESAVAGKDASSQVRHDVQLTKSGLTIFNHRQCCWLLT